MLGFSPIADAPLGAPSPAEQLVIYADGILVSAGHQLQGLTASPNVVYGDGSLEAAGHQIDGLGQFLVVNRASGSLSAAGARISGQGSIRKVIYSDGAMISTAHAMFGSDLFRREIRTDRPPLNLFERVYRSTSAKVLGGWTYVTQPPTYIVEDRIDPQNVREVESRYITTAMSFSGGSANVSIKVLNFDEGQEVILVDSLDVSAGTKFRLPVGKAILKSQDMLYVRVNSGDELVVSLHYVANQREEFEVV